MRLQTPEQIAEAVKAAQLISNNHDLHDQQILTCNPAKVIRTIE